MSRAPSRVTRALDDTLVMGLLIVAIVVAILYISYTALSGLPWQQTNSIEVLVPDAGKLAKNTEVRIGGARVGQILRIDAVPRDDDTPAHAVLDVQLDGDVAPLPVDTRAEVRLASALGGKYLALTPGRSERTIPWDGVLGLESTSSTVDIEEAFKVFDPESRDDVRAFLRGLGDSVAGRGGDVNATIEETARLLPGLQRVLATLADPRTDLPGLVRGMASTASALHAARDALGPFVANATATFGALDAAGGALGESVAELPATERTAQRALRTLRPVLDDAAALARDLRPAADVLTSAAHRMHATATTATEVAPRFGTLARPMDRAFAAVGTFADNPASTGALEALGGEDLATFGTSSFVGLGAILKTTWDAERHCRVASTWQQRLAAMASDGDAGGNWMRMLPIFETGQSIANAHPSANLHANPYPNQNAEECEAGNEGYSEAQLIGNPPGLQTTPEAGR
jgi:virulence factor Mce-like protein